MRRPVHVIVAGAGLAGLSAAHHLGRAGAEVTVIEARDRVGGRVHTVREGLAAGQHAEAGADLIEEEQHDLLALARAFRLEPVRILRTGWGFYGTTNSGALRTTSAPGTFEKVQELLHPEIEAYKAAGSRLDSAVARWLGAQSVASWLKRVKADRALQAGVRGLRGFFLADPEDLSLLPLVEQFAGGGIPGKGRMYRLREGNAALPAALARSLRGRLLLKTVVKSVSRSARKVRIAVDDGRRREVAGDFAVLALPASTLRAVEIDPSLPDDQRRAIAALRYGPATRIILQFESRFWKRRGRRLAYGSDRPFGAVWDGNEQQRGTAGILTLLAGGRASREVQALVNRHGWPGLVRALSWLGRPSRLTHALAHVWESDSWSKGGYAVFDCGFDPVLRGWLARPAGRLVFAGEHTSLQWQGYMNGAVESGRRAALEVAVMAGLDYGAIAL